MAKPDDDPNNTKVLYQCTCGRQLELNEDKGGICPDCDRSISPKLLHHDLAMTMTIATSPRSHADNDHDPGTLYLGDKNLTVNDSFDVTASESELKGRMFGHFRIVDSLGSGGMGQVFRALDTSLKRYVAVKVLRSGLGSSSGRSSSDFEVDQLLQEAITQARVTHPNITTIYYVGRQNNDPFLAMELIHGETVAEKIESGPLPQYSQLHSIASQIAGALRFSHELDIIHGDIKPSNIMVQHDGVAKLSDFGLARRASKKQTAPFGGTPNYLAPELLQGKPNSIQSDMYALGVTLFEMTFGRLPINVSGRTVEQWMQSHKNESIVFPNPWPEHIAEEWKDLLLQLLAKNPDQRFDSWREVEQSLEQIEPAKPILAKRVPRLVAAVIDMFLVSLLAAPMAILEQLPLIGDWFETHSWTFVSLKVASEFGAILAYTAMLVFWKQSPGRKLMQVRVVNDHGLKPSGEKIATRSLLRMLLIWFLTVSAISAEGTTWMVVAAQVVGAIGLLFTLVDAGVMLLHSKRKSLHDLISNTFVVIDTD